MGLFSSIFGKKKKDEPPYPSWASDNTKMQGFISTLKEKAEQRSIP